MAENTRAGREPIQVVQLDQDFCTRTWGDSYSGCLAGPDQNLINSSRDLQDLADFSRGGTVNNAGFGIDGVSQALSVDLSENLTANFTQQESNAAVLNAEINTIYASIDFRLQSGNSTAEASLFFIVFYAGGGTNSGEVARVRVQDGTIISKPAQVTATVADLGGGWYRLTGSRSDFAASFGVGPDDKIGLAVFARGGTGNGVFSRPQITVNEATNYAITTGLPARGLFSENPCFNTRSTCQDPANYDKGVLSLKFTNKSSPGLTDDYYLPMLTRPPKVTPAKLNPGGADRSSRALGTRAQINVQLLDSPHNDRLVDPYRDDREYDPLERGTFWTKWRARNPYYMQRPLKLLSGYLVNGELVDTITREFVITGFSGPDANGNVTLEGKDVLTLAEDEKAQAPIASKGKLSADITAGATSATLTPAGIGNEEYPASGQVRIGKEVCSFTRSGDSLTLTRGQFGTEAKSHDADDTVQLCLRYVSEDPQDILYDLLLNYANVPAAYLDKTQWDAEALDFLPRKYTAIITEPTGVSQLIGEMCQQMYFTIWWDERISKVVLKAVRLAQEDEVTELDDARHLIQDSISWKDLADELVTQVWVYYGQIDPTDKLDQGSNYSTIAITADPSAEGADKHNLRRIKTIFSRWIDATNASAAEDLGQRILNRYGNAPRQVTFKVDAKDDALWLGAYIRLTNRLRVDLFGRPVPVNLQVFQASESIPGSEYQFTAQEFIPALIGGDQVEDPNERVIPITSDLLNVNLRTLHDSLFGAPTGSETITFVVREGVTVGGDTAGGGVNVPLAQRVTTNDFYDGGTSSVTGAAVGQIPILQRRGIGSPTTTSKGAAYGSLGNAAYDVKEYPVSVGLQTGTWPSGVTLALIVEAGAAVLGQGANGSAHYTDSSDPAYTANTSLGDKLLRGIPGGDGGDALEIDYAISITNGGVIAGGGAGGGPVVFVPYDDAGTVRLDAVFGGGGAGLLLSGVKENATFDDTPVTAKNTFSATDAQPGSETQPGDGGTKATRFGQIRRITQTASDGGALATEAANGSIAVQPFSGTVQTVSNTGAGGQAGKAIASGANLIEWVNKGDVRGDEVA